MKKHSNSTTLYSKLLLKMHNYKPTKPNRHVWNTTPKTAEYLLTSAQGTSSRIDDVLGHKTSVNKSKKNEIIQFMFSDHHAVKLEINIEKDFRKISNMWKFNTSLYFQVSVVS